MSNSEEPKHLLRGRPLALDPSAKSASQTKPAFIAKPEGAPAYYGFQILADIVVDGFTFGKISDFEAEPCSEGDAFVIAPDNSRAGLIWEVSETSYFREVCVPDSTRWGVWGVSFPYAMSSREDVRKNLEHILPKLRRHWQEWRDQSPE